MMKLNIKKVVKFAGAVGAAAGIVALSSVVASGVAVTAVKEGVKAAKDAMKRVLDEQKEADLFDDEPLNSEPIVKAAPAAVQEEAAGAEPVAETGSKPN